MDIKELVKKAHENAKKKGFWEDYFAANAADTTAVITNDIELKHFTTMFLTNEISTRLMLIVSELAEALEGLRKGDSDNFKEEMADVAIRLADLCGGLDIDLEAEIIKKMDKNKDRPYKHGKAF